ncbi:MAG: hydrogenase iron-sulfur subunit [Sulfuriflexus sp.]|nr:hydrogenase iron-sulfur subunit [Sulfuriflexus sp.]
MNIINPLKYAYLAMEAWFNLAFGSEWNPLYNMGRLAFFFFWIVFISGLYLFIFFDTSLTGAYASVEYITHEQWYIAGIMRSLHRYASDAAVVTIILHMFREFALGRYRGFRWFSWVTGVPALWLVITLGITGYWLVWDELAIYVAMLSSQLIDALPLISGSMSRNFVGEQLSDRFFSLMAFLHFSGQPLFLIFALWLHVKRLSLVKVTAPRGLAIGSFIGLLVLSIISPAVSHGPADASQVTAALELDWFYLNVYPLLGYFTAGQTWLITLGTTLFLMALPWLPAKKTGPAAVVHLEQCNGCEQCAEDCPYDAITVQARTDGAKFEHEVTVNADMCAACGICVGSCPASNPFRQKNEQLVTGIDMPQMPINEIRNTLDKTIADLKGNNKIIVLGCDNSLDYSQFETDSIKVVGLFCIGMMPATLVEYALANGVDGVFVTGCRTGDCYFRYGNIWMDKRFAGTRQPVLRRRAKRSRIKVSRAAITDGTRFQKELIAFQSHIEKLNGDEELAHE